jgi:DNA-binding transcriptional regulator YiaG
MKSHARGFTNEPLLVIMEQVRKQRKVTALKKLRESAEVTQEQIARHLNVSLSTVKRWDRGQIEPALTRQSWEKLCSLLNVQFDELPPLLSELGTEEN